MDRGRVSMLVTLDISAAFDTIDPSILLERLKTYFGVTGKALEWIRSYLDLRKQFVKINGVESLVSSLCAGVPQGSVLGPVLFSAFIAPLSDVIDSFKIRHHQYADDTNLYNSFSSLNQHDNLTQVSNCLDAVNNWFLTNGLLVNPSKSDSIYVGTLQQIKKMNDTGVIMGGTSVPLSDMVKSLGVLIDQQLTLDKHVKNVCKICNYHIKGLRSLRPSLNNDTAESIGRSIVMSRLDYCNSLLAKTSEYNIHRLQMVQNSLARLVAGAGFRQSIKPILSSLHWLPVKQRIDYKLCTLVFKSRMNLLPDYLTKELKVYVSTRPIRSKQLNTYVIPRVKTEVAKHSFFYAGVELWNDLPDNMRSQTSLPIFKKQLKTHLFSVLLN